MTNSRRKGVEGEREVAGYLRQSGYETRRGQQYSGIEGKDVIGLPGIHIEVKRVERLNIDNAMDQARRDAGEEEIPVVAHRKNYSPWLITMTLEDWIQLYREWEASHALKERGL